MRRTTPAPILAVLLSTFACGPGPAGDPAAGSDEPEAATVSDSAVTDTLARLADRFSRAYVDQDLEAIAAAYTEDALVLFGQGPIVRGREAIVPHFTTSEGTRVIHHRIVPLDVEIEGDMASDVGHYEVRAVVDGDTTPMGYGKYAIVWRRGEDGAWRIAVDMWGPRPAPADSAPAVAAPAESAPAVAAPAESAPADRVDPAA